ncbi:MAG: response regulator transcription factor [Desulfobacterales bacterium]|nr:response regulator transcription factor [Desulfobacterales bacterium]
MTIRIIVADDHRIVRNGLRTLLNSEPDIEVIAEAENGRKTVQLVRELIPDVVVMDVTMPDLNGIEATRQILAEFPQVKIIALSMHHHEQFVTGMLMAGASGYLLKDCSVEELTAAIRAATKGEVYLSPGVANAVIKNYVSQLKKSEKSIPPLLTPRQAEVLQLVSEGKTSKQIASIMNISAKTVDTHRRQMMAKLNVSSIAQLTKYAIRSGLTSLDT